MKQSDETYCGQTIRQMAERVIKITHSASSSELSEAEILKLIHELQIHQIELELQNEELIEAKKLATDAAENKYAELYDFAPAGIFTLSKEGKIIELNLCAANLLGKERGFLKNSRFDSFISKSTKPVFKQFYENLFLCNNKETCEISLDVNRELPVYAFLTGRVTQNRDECLLTIIDITEHKQIEEERRQSQEKLRDFTAMLQQNREEERKSIAREIHDEFGQALNAIKMNLTKLGNDITQTEKPFSKVAIMDEINNMKNIIDQTIQNIGTVRNIH